jgi:tRNA threonylcarbamoyladenosine biosynthesis protein TsaE
MKIVTKQKTIKISQGPEETFALGKEIGAKCLGGEVFLFDGPLGAGKTALIQGLAVGLGVTNRVNSPTFNILKLYKTKNGGKIKNFCHIDAYRLNSGKDLSSLGVEEFLSSQETVTAIEWASKVKSVWPKNGRLINMEDIGENKRKITFCFQSSGRRCENS